MHALVDAKSQFNYIPVLTNKCSDRLYIGADHLWQFSDIDV